MIAWLWILGASLAAYLTKLAGYLVPAKLLDKPGVIRVFGAMTIGLLAALVMVNTFDGDGGLTLDSRILALAVAAVALALRAPFLLVVVLGAAAAALGRLIGLA